mgnify:CR=1 FL=1
MQRRQVLSLLTGSAAALALGSFCSPQEVKAVATMQVEKFSINLNGTVHSYSLPASATFLGANRYATALNSLVSLLSFAVDPSAADVTRKFRAQFIGNGSPGVYAYDDAVEVPIGTTEKEQGNGLINTFIIFEVF